MCPWLRVEVYLDRFGIICGTRAHPGKNIKSEKIRKLGKHPANIKHPAKCLSSVQGEEREHLNTHICTYIHVYNHPVGSLSLH